MKRALKIVGVTLLVAVVGATLFGAVAFAEGSTSSLPNLFGLLGEGKLGRWMSDYTEQFLDAVATKLGVERAALDTAVQEAQKDVINQAVTDGKLTQEQANWLLDPEAAMKAKIEQAVADGEITQEQADWLLQGVEEGYIPSTRGFDGHRGGGHSRGMMTPSESGRRAPSTESQSLPTQ